ERLVNDRIPAARAVWHRTECLLAFAGERDRQAEDAHQAPPVVTVLVSAIMVKVRLAVWITGPKREPERNFSQPARDGSRSTETTVPGMTLSEISLVF